MSCYPRPAASGNDSPPPRVQAAQNYLHYAHGVRFQENPFTPLSGDTPKEDNGLSEKEQVTYNAALQVLLQYFLGEMDFGDSPPMPPSDDEDPKRPVPEPVT